MKRFFLLSLLGACTLGINAQELRRTPVDNNVSRQITDKDFNDLRLLVVGKDNVMIGDLICFDGNWYPAELKFIYPQNGESFVIRDINEKHDSLVVAPHKYIKPLVVGGFEYDRVVRMVYPMDVEWLPLTEVAKAYGHNVKGDVLYMINDRIISRGVPGYKLQKDFILRVEVESSKDIPTLSKKQDFSIVRVYTKTTRYAEIAKDGRIH